MPDGKKAFKRFTQFFAFEAVCSCPMLCCIKRRQTECFVTKRFVLYGMRPVLGVFLDLEGFICFMNQVSTLLCSFYRLWKGAHRYTTDTPHLEWQTSSIPLSLALGSRSLPLKEQQHAFQFPLWCNFSGGQPHCDRLQPCTQSI